MLRGSGTERATLSQGSHANWTAWAHSANGFAVSSPSYSRGFRFALTGMAQGIELA